MLDALVVVVIFAIRIILFFRVSEHELREASHAKCWREVACGCRRNIRAARFLNLQEPIVRAVIVVGLLCGRTVLFRRGG